jgi:hypothetical protein|tara:strand:- start:501 stop:650 length:150 start_codon:yes stop_codon:yes gene_type:complete
MKTSIFDMTFVLPPMVEMTEVKKDMPTLTTHFSCGGPPWLKTICIRRLL